MDLAAFSCINRKLTNMGLAKSSHSGAAVGKGCWFCECKRAENSIATNGSCVASLSQENADEISRGWSVGTSEVPLALQNTAVKK